MGRRTRFLALCVVASTIVGAPGAHADQTQRITYVANTVGYYTDLDRFQPAGPAVHGIVRFTPRTSTIRLRIDDLTVLDGQTVAVSGLERRCLRVRVVETLRVVPGKEMAMVILGDGAWLPDKGPGCTGHASGGTAEVRL